MRKKILKKRFFRIGFLLLLFFSNDFLANEAMQTWEIQATPFTEIKRKYEWGIVLTGVTNRRTEPRDRVYFSHGADRVVHAVQLYKLGIVRKLLVSGGGSLLVDDGRREADELKEALLLMGVPENDIVIEKISRNTRESALEVPKILKRFYRPEDCLLITSAFHMRRSLACYKKVGWAMDTFTVDFYSHPTEYYPDALFIPKVDAISLWTKLSKEWTGMIAYKLAGYI